jgi:hypothetical protein
MPPISTENSSQLCHFPVKLLPARFERAAPTYGHVHSSTGCALVACFQKLIDAAHQKVDIVRIEMLIVYPL